MFSSTLRPGRHPARLRLLALLLLCALLLYLGWWWRTWLAEAVSSRVWEWPAPYRGHTLVERDLPYAGGDGTRLAYDVHAPRDYRRTPYPVLIWIHGGGWRDGDKGDETAMFFSNAWAEMGFVVLSVNYRLGLPGRPAPFPAATDDIAAFVAHLNTRLASFGAGTRPAVSIAGHSAGGHLALYQATAAASALPFACVVALAPVTDLRAGDFPQGVPPYIAGFAADEKTRVAASPLFRVDHLRARAVLLAHAGNDQVVPVSQSGAMARALAARWPQVPALGFFPALGGHTLPRHRLLASTSDFLQRHCRQ